MLARNIAAGDLTGDDEGWVVSLQERFEDGVVTGTWLSFHSGDGTVARVQTDAEFELHRWEVSKIDLIEGGYRITARSPPEPGERIGESVFFDGPVDRLIVEQRPEEASDPNIGILPATQPVTLYINDRKHDAGLAVEWARTGVGLPPTVNTTKWTATEATFRTFGLLATEENERLAVVTGLGTLAGVGAGYLTR